MEQGIIFALLMMGLFLKDELLMAKFWGWLNYFSKWKLLLWIFEKFTDSFKW